MPGANLATGVPSRCVAPLLLLSLLGSAGCGEGIVGQGLTAAERRPSVVNGTPTSDFPAVVRIILSQGGRSVGACSATVVGHRTVLTAAHCLVEDAHRLQAAVVFGDELYATTGTPNPSFGSKPKEADIAVLRLDRDAPVTPMPVATVPPSLLSRMTLVGFGLTDRRDPNSAGSKHEGANYVVLRTEYNLHTLGPQPGDSGDSGGAVLAQVDGEQALAGVHTSRLLFVPPHNRHVRVDAHLNWIRQVAQGDVFVVGEQPPDDDPPDDDPPDDDPPDDDPPDDDPPRVAFIAPRDGAEIPPTFTVLAHLVPERHIADVSLEVDGELSAENLSAPFDEFSLTLPADGHELRLVVRYENGERAETSINVTVVDKAATEPPEQQPDTTPPLVAILSPQPGVAVTSMTEVTAEVYDESGLASVVLLRNGELIGGFDGEPYELLVELPPGPQRLSVVAHDLHGNRGSAEVQIVVVADAVEGGCGVLPAAPSTPPLWLLALLALALCCRPRDR